MATWGATTLNVTEYSRDSARILLNEKKLIPDPTAASTTPQTVLMGSGRERKRVTISGYSTIAEFQAMEIDKYSFTKRAIDMTDIEDGLTLTNAIIETLSGNRVKGTSSTDYMVYSCTFLEV